MPDVENASTYLVRRDEALAELERARPREFQCESDEMSGFEGVDPAIQPVYAMPEQAYCRLVQLNAVFARSAIRFHERPGATRHDDLASEFAMIALELRDALAEIAAAPTAAPLAEAA